MKDNKCKLIATLTNLENEKLINEIFSEECVEAVRFNTIVNENDIENNVKKLKELALKYKKEVWLDLKGRQLRISKWPSENKCVEINHYIKAKQPAYLLLCGIDKYEISKIEKNYEGAKIYLKEEPMKYGCKGMTLNIISNDVENNNGLTYIDKEYLRLCKKYDLNNIMLSFYETDKDIDEIKAILPNANIVGKIENKRAVRNLIENNSIKYMAARDDLSCELEDTKEVFKALESIIKVDRNAICASKIFSSLKEGNKVKFSDFSDLELMYRMGYRNFMLGDGVCKNNLQAVFDAWKQFVSNK